MDDFGQLRTLGPARSGGSDRADGLHAVGWSTQKSTTSKSPAATANDMVAAGWERAKVDEAVASGMRYSPARNTVLTPMIRGGFGDGFDTEFDDE